mgnify:CR=1 FL=1
MSQPDWKVVKEFEDTYKRKPAVGAVYGKIAAWLAVHGLREGGVTWEQYLSDPLVTPPEERETWIYVLLAD